MALKFRRGGEPPHQFQRTEIFIVGVSCQVSGDCCQARRTKKKKKIGHTINADITSPCTKN